MITSNKALEVFEELADTATRRHMSSSPDEYKECSAEALLAVLQAMEIAE